MIKKIIQYITYDIWFKREHEYKSPKVRWAVQQFKVFLFTAQGFGEHSILVRSAALTFYTLMSLVPIAALVFGIAKGFGLDEGLSQYLYSEFPQYRTLIDQILQFANAMLLKTRGGLIASVGVVVLFWAVIKVFGQVENAFNNIWEVHKSRSFTRKVSDYMAVIFVTPILWVISNSALLQVQNELLHLAGSPTVTLLFQGLSLVTVWAMFGFIYRVLPNTKVRLRSAIVAGIVAGSIFQLFQVVYFYIQSELSSYNAIYGSFAAIPLFLIWLQTSWQILLIGGELSFAYQNIRKFEYEKRAEDLSYEYRKKVMLVVMTKIVNHYTQQDGAVASEQIATELNLPVRIVRDVINDLEKAHLLVSTLSDDEKTNLYLPARDIHTLTIYEVVKRVEAQGQDALEINHSSEFQRVDSVMSNLDVAIEKSPYNILLMEMDKQPKQPTA